MKSIFALAAAAAAVTASNAGAATFDFSYLTFFGTSVTGKVEATDLGGFYVVDGVTGSRNGAAIDRYDFFDDTPQSFNFNGGRASNVDFSYYVGADNFEVRYPGSGFGTEFTNSNSSDLITNFSFAPSAATPGAVPEPATWAMMLLGFGMIGFGMRYGVRRSNAKFDLKVKRIAAGLEA